MSTAASAERLVAARSEVKRACDLLIATTPEALNRCQEALAQAVYELREFRSQCGESPGDSTALSTAAALRGELRRANRLLQNLASFYRGWERILGTMSAGYTSGGDPAPVARTGRLCCRG
jgi:hypothetical protein